MWLAPETGMTQTPDKPLNPGDEARPGTPATGENICPECDGKGRTARGETCRNCGGTGKVIRGIGGA
jgi:RecJ-like exonuclease